MEWIYHIFACENTILDGVQWKIFKNRLNIFFEKFIYFLEPNHNLAEPSVLRLLLIWDIRQCALSFVLNLLLERYGKPVILQYLQFLNLY